MKNKVLVIHDYMTPNTGGANCLSRNIKSLKDIAGEENVLEIDTYNIPTKPNNSIFNRIKRKLKGIDTNLISQIHKSLLKEIEKHNPSVIWFERSTFGDFAKKIKKLYPNIKIITFFQNFEYKYFDGKYQTLSTLRRHQLLNQIKGQEKNALRYSDINIALTEEERKTIKEFYNKDIDAIIPISLPDQFKDSNNIKVTEPNKIKNLLFVGSYFFGNTDGLNWFIKEVLPFTNCHLTVIGKGMEALKKDFNDQKNLTIHGFVDDLSSYYKEADAILLPIISGAGMKVKVAEALMFGKHIIGTPLALEGYEITPKEATVCDTKEDFLKQLTNLEVEKYVPSSRELYLDKYSYDATLSKLKELLLK